MPTRAPRSANAMASGRPTWPQPPITTTWRSNWPDSDVPVIAYLPTLSPAGWPRHPLDAQPYRYLVYHEFHKQRSPGAAGMPLSCPSVAGTIPLLTSVNSNDVRRAREEYRMGGSEVETPVADTGTMPASHARTTSPWPRRWAWSAGFAAAGLALFAAYLRQAQTVPVISDGGSFALQAWDMLHGNVLLRGWTTGDLSYYTTELPQYALVELAHGLNADVVHIATAMTYTLLVLGAALLARGHAAGREGAVRMLVAAGIMLAPTLGTASATLLSSANHTGTQVAMVVIWLILDRARPHWWVPVLVSVLLAWVQVGDPLVLYEGVMPLVIVCVIQAYRRRGPLSDSWYELSLAAGAIVSVGAASVTLRLIHYFGGFVVRPPTATFAVVATLYSNVWVAVESVLLLFGARLLGRATRSARRHRTGPPGRRRSSGVGDLACPPPVRDPGDGGTGPGRDGDRAAGDLCPAGEPERRRQQPRDRGRAAHRRGPGRPAAGRGPHQ